MSGHFRSQCRALRLGTRAVLLLLALLVATGTSGLWFPEGVAPPEDFLRRFALLVVQALPAISYLWALWSVQRALGDLALGRIFSSTLARALRHVGIGVLAGSLLKVFAVTNLTRLLIEVRGSYAYFDMSAVVLGVVGAALVLLAKIVDEARLVQAELDEIL